jgi:hypothetical protein
MEITARSDIGTDLHAPRASDSGKETPTYSLVREVSDGDLVLHYEKSQSAITAWSIAYGGLWEEPTVWGTPRSTGPSGSPVTPYVREGLWQGLRGPFRLPEPLTLAEIRELEAEVAANLEELKREHGGSLYFPFQLRRDGLRAAQGYLLKMPASLLEVLPKLPDLLDDVPAPPPSPPRRRTTPGREYRHADLAAPRIESDPFSVDPSIVERGLTSHARLQNLLAEYVADLGLEPRSPGPLDPPWDLLWSDGDSVFVAEIKSLTLANEERQLRLGLGQVLIYRQRLQRILPTVEAILMVEWEPRDPDWHALCDELEVRLLWPASLRGSSPPIH